jgi:hypothetical protein
LVGATPSVFKSYISTAYGGSTSDRQIVGRSRLLKICNPGNSIMANKGLMCQDKYCAQNIKMNTPKLKKKNIRMSCATVIENRKISTNTSTLKALLDLPKHLKY